MKKFILPLTIVFATFASHASAEPHGPLILTLGERHLLKAASPRIWIADPKILRAEWVGSGFNLIPRQTGSVDVQLGGIHRRVLIWTPSAKRTLEPLREITEKIPGLKVERGERGPVLLGRLYRLKDLNRIIEHLPADAHWENASQHDPGDLQSWLATRLRETGHEAHPIVRFPFAHVRLKTKNPSLERTLRRLGLAVQEDASSIKTEPVVRVEIAVAEVRKSSQQTLGLSPTTSYTAKVLPTGSWESSGFDLAFNAFESEGHGRILARPNLICRSGAEAEFLAGGEFPIKLLNERVNDVVWKKYGISLKVRPLADASGRISLQLSTEISTIDTTLTVDQIPAMLTNRVSSHFDLLGPRTIALSGLLRSEDHASKSGIWGLSSVPILGALFSSRDWKKFQSELVIFVRPEILKEGTP